MLTALQHFLSILLWDEAKAQRYLMSGCFMLGMVLSNGGTIPGTGTVLPGLQRWYWLGPYLQGAALFMGGGASLPGRKNGNGTVPPASGK